MIAEPTLLSRSVQKENSTVDVSSCTSGNHSAGVRNENRQKNVRGKRKVREGSENAKRKHSKSSNGSLGRAENEQLKNRDIEAVTLFEVVTMGRSAMQAVVDDWIEAYIMDREPALLDLISFFIQCSGCKGVVTAEMFQSKEDTDVMSKMVEDLDEDSGEYPLVMSGLYWKKFRSHFCEFVSVLVAQCQYSVIFDNYLLNTLISLLTELSASCVRAFRHTCTLAAVKLLSALVNVALSLSVSVDNSQRLYEVELAKTSSKRVSPRLERIQRKITELQDRKLETEDMMDAIFKGVFLKRYRDVIPEIRAICMEELTVWMKLYSPVFLNDTYLKYVGWMMHDKQPDVRLKCVLGLQALYQDVHLSSKMDLFTSRFKERMISMTLDKDHEVAVQAMRLLMVISQSCDDVLSQDDYKHIFQFVYCSHRPLAATAGEFLYAKIHMRKQEVMTTFVLFWLQFLHQHVLYVVDSLWDSGGALLKDWASLTSLLTAQPPSQEQVLSSAEEALVIEILLASVRQAAEGPPLAGRSTGKKVISTKEKRLQTDDCTMLTEHFLKVLPELLSKYLEDAEKLTSFLKIPQYFQMDSCGDEYTKVLCCLVCFLQALLAGLDAAVGRHSEARLLEEAARSYHSLCAEDSRWQQVSVPAMDQLIQRWTCTLEKCLGEELSVSVVVVLSRDCTQHRQTFFQPLMRNLCKVVLKENVRSSTCLVGFFFGTVFQAFMCLSDILVAHNYQLQMWDPSAGAPVLYTPEPKLQKSLLSFVLEHVFTSPEPDGHSSRGSDSECGVSRLEDLHRRRNLLAAYCKLIVHSVLEMSMAAEIFKQYVKYYNDFGDIIKETLNRTRQMDKIESARTLVLCLQQQDSGNTCSSAVQTYSSIKELARRFSLTFGWDQIKFRESLAMIHRDGIEFVFQGFVQESEKHSPPNISYLTILSEFSGKLLKPDKKTIYSYLQRFAGEQTINNREECWMPLIYYRASLQGTAEGEDAVSFISSDTNKQPSLTNRSKSPSIRQAISEGTSSQEVTKSALLIEVSEEQQHYIVAYFFVKRVKYADVSQVSFTHRFGLQICLQEIHDYHHRV
uniref:Cohesin subunit SA n=1 Tax=Pygocentrus nattereri TaxID=42514 RepID=A0AAR2L5C1_PYGNA